VAASPVGVDDFELFDSDEMDTILGDEVMQDAENVNDSSFQTPAIIEATQKLVDSMKRSQMTRDFLRGAFRVSHSYADDSRCSLQTIMAAQSA